MMLHGNLGASFDAQAPLLIVSLDVVVRGGGKRDSLSYDSDELVKTIETADAIANIPPRSNRIDKRPVDWHRYKARHLVECFFNRLKQFRRIATRYDKLSGRFNAFLHLACAYVWLL